MGKHFNEPLFFKRYLAAMMLVCEMDSVIIRETIF